MPEPRLVPVYTTPWGRAYQADSLQLLRTDHIELIQVHNLLDWRVQLATLRGWKREKRITYLGITHYTPRAHDDARATREA